MTKRTNKTKFEQLSFENNSQNIVIISSGDGEYEVDYLLTSEERTLIFWLLKNLKNNGEEQDYVISLKELSTMLGYNSEHKNVALDIEHVIRGIFRKPVVLRKIKSKRTVQMNWLSAVYYNKEKTSFSFSINPHLLEFIPNFEAQLIKPRDLLDES